MCKCRYSAIPSQVIKVTRQVNEEDCVECQTIFPEPRPPLYTGRMEESGLVGRRADVVFKQPIPGAGDALGGSVAS